MTLPLCLSKAFNKGKRIASEPPKRLEEKYFKCHGYGHFQANCPNQRILSTKEVEEIQDIEEEWSEEEYEEDYHTLVTLDVGELLVIWRSLHAKEVPLDLAKESKSFTPDALLEARFANSSLIGVVAPMWLLQNLLKSFKSPLRCIPPLILFNGSSKETR